MDILGSIADFGLSIASGGVVGLIGSLFGGVAKFFQERQRQKWEKDKWQHEYNLHELNLKAMRHETEMELAIESQKGAWKGLSASLRADKAGDNVSGWVNNIRALFRPFLTLCLWGVGAYVFYTMTQGALRQWISPETEVNIIVYIVQTVFFCASTATVWWFGDRALSPPGAKHR